MTRFLKYIILFFLPIILLAGAAELYLRNLPNEYSFKDEWMRNNAHDLKTLVIGSSKAYYGIRPQFFSSKSFNLATISERPDYDFFVINKYIDQCDSLKTVIYPVFYEMFSDPPFEECEEWPRAAYFKIYMDCPYHSAFSKYNLEIASPVAAMEKFRNYKADGCIGCDSLGYGLHCLLKNKNMEAWNSGEEARQSALRHTIKNSRFVDFNYQYVNRIAELCRQHNIKLIMVTLPCDSRYVELLDSSQLNLFFHNINKVKNDNQAEFHDFMNDPRFSSNDFFDSNHLSELGAKKITLILDSLITN